MKNAIIFLAISFMASMVYAAPPVELSEFDLGKWERLGSKKVSFKLDRDVIKVGLRDGGFRKLKVQVTGGSLNMHKMVVEYGNGQKEIINVRHNFSPRSGTRVIDLDGGKRVIKDITFWYDSKVRARGKATVHVFGRH